MFIISFTYEDSNGRTYMLPLQSPYDTSLYTSAKLIFKNQEQLGKPEFHYNDLVEHLKIQRDFVSMQRHCSNL